MPARKMGGLNQTIDPETRSPARDIAAVNTRVTSGDQREDLDCQVARVSAGATNRGYAIDRMVTKVGSARS